jgi:putative transposase
MSTRQKVELARRLCASGSPINKSQVARTLGIARSSLYVQPKRPKMDKALAVRIEQLHEHDDTMGHRKLAVMLATGKNRVKRVMRKYGIQARRKRKKYTYAGKASQVAPNLLRVPEQVQDKEIVFVFHPGSAPLGWVARAGLLCLAQTDPRDPRAGL